MGDLKKRIGEILIEDGCLTLENLDEALAHQKKEGGMIGQILVRLGYISEEDLIAAVGKQLKIPYIPLSNYSANLEICPAFGEDFCRRNIFFPFDQDEKKIYIALADPMNESLLQDILKKTSLKPQVFISTPSEIFTMLDLVFTPARKEMKKAG